MQPAMKRLSFFLDTHNFDYDCKSELNSMIILTLENRLMIDPDLAQLLLKRMYRSLLAFCLYKSQIAHREIV